MSNANIFVIGSKFSGSYNAPFPFGKTEFTLCISSANLLDGSFEGKGQDKQGDFLIHGKVYQDGKVEFIKDYVDKSHTGIVYEGIADGNTVKGKYKFIYKTFLVNMNICEDFSMSVM